MTYTKEQVLAIIGEDEKNLSTENAISNEGDTKRFYRNELRAEQRKRLENTRPKKTREVIQYC